MPITALIFLLLFFVGCSAALLIDAVYGIYLYVFSYFLNAPGRWWGASLPSLRYSFIMGVIIILGFAVRSGRYSATKIFDAPQTKWLLMIGIVMILTSPIAANGYEHQKFLIIFWKYILFYILLIKLVDTPEKFERLMSVFLLGQFYLGWLAYQSGRASGQMDELGAADSRDSNGAAALMIVSVPILLNYLIIGKKWQKLCALPMLVFILNGIILINSRGAIVALGVSVLYYLFISMKAPSFPKFNKAKVLGTILVGVMILGYLSDPLFLEKMGTITQDENEYYQGYTGRERTFFWITTFDMVKDYPFGSGALGYDYRSAEYLAPELLDANTHTRAVHSLYFQVLAEYGYHGFILFIIFLFSCYRFMWKLRRSLKEAELHEEFYIAVSLEAGFLAVLIAGVFISTFYMEINYWMAAFFAAYGNIYRKQISQIDENATLVDTPNRRFPEVASKGYNI